MPWCIKIKNIDQCDGPGEQQVQCTNVGEDLSVGNQEDDVEVRDIDHNSDEETAWISLFLFLKHDSFFDDICYWKSVKLTNCCAGLYVTHWHMLNPSFVCRMSLWKKSYIKRCIWD